MTAVETTSWIEHNQQRFGAAVTALMNRIEGLGLAPDEPPAPLDLDVPALDRLGLSFGLSSFERGILLMAAAVEFNGAMPQVCALANGDTRRPWPTFGLTLAVLADGFWSAIAPSGPLRRYRLIHIDAAENLTTARIRVDERVMHLMLGVEELDQRLAPFVTNRRVQARWLPPSQQQIADSIADHYLVVDNELTGHVQAAQLSGADREQRRAVVDAVAINVGAAQVLQVEVDALPPAGPELDDLLGRLARECLVSGSLIAWQPSATPTKAWVLDQLVGFEGVRVLVESTQRTSHDLRMPVFDVGTPSIDEQRQIWRRVLGGEQADIEAICDRLARQFMLTSEIVESVVHAAGPDAEMQGLWDGCRLRLRSDVGGSAAVRDADADWSRLVLPEDALRLLQSLEAEATYKGQVYEQWGLDSGGRRARGTSALFCGPSGTGKTLAAEVIAHSLNVDLLHVDLSQVVNKYIGETEKNLARVFDAGERGGAVLLFDECDALFGKRTEIKDSHDRYANIEVSYLLQRMEAYSGVAILTTNMRANLDPAFVRRLRFIVTFPHPDRVQRQQIWKAVFPDQVDTSNLEPALLAGLDISGGVIVNIAMAAALRAAADDSLITMAHIRTAAAIEYMKLERPLTGRELAGWS